MAQHIKLELVFRTKSGVDLFASVDQKSQEVVAFHSSNKDEVFKALKQDLCSSNPMDRNWATMLYVNAKTLGIKHIQRD